MVHSLEVLARQNQEAIAKHRRENVIPRLDAIISFEFRWVAIGDLVHASDTPIDATDIEDWWRNDPSNPYPKDSDYSKRQGWVVEKLAFADRRHGEFAASCDNVGVGETLNELKLEDVFERVAKESREALRDGEAPKASHHVTLAICAKMVGEDFEYDMWIWVEGEFDWSTGTIKRFKTGA